MSDISGPFEEDLLPIEKAAILLLAMGDDEAANVLKHLEPREVQRVGAAMAALGRIDARQIDRVVNHFLEAISVEPGPAMGANDYLRKMLLGALGDRRGGSMLDRLVGTHATRLDKLKWMDARAIAEFILDEPPQMQAIVLSYLEPDRAARVLDYIPEAADRADLIMRVAGLESSPPGAHQDAVFEPPTGRQPPGRCGHLGGKRAAASIASRLGAAAIGAVIDGVRARDHMLAEEIQVLLATADPDRNAS